MIFRDQLTNLDVDDLSYFPGINKQSDTDTNNHYKVCLVIEDVK